MDSTFISCLLDGFQRPQGEVEIEPEFDLIRLGQRDFLRNGVPGYVRTQTGVDEYDRSVGRLHRNVLLLLQ